MDVPLYRAGMVESESESESEPEPVPGTSCNVNDIILKSISWIAIIVKRERVRKRGDEEREGERE